MIGAWERVSARLVQNVAGPRMQRGLPTQRPLPGVAHIVAVASGKGGVGKSTVATNLAVALARDGCRVGVLDADLYGPSVPRMLGLRRPGEGVPTHERMLEPLWAWGVKCMSMGLLVDEEAPIVWRGLMVMKAIEQLLRQVHWEPLDLLVIDMPPGTGDTQLSISQLVPLSGVVMVTTPQDVAVADVRKGVEMFRKVNVPVLGMVKNMSRYVCVHCGTAEEIYPVGPDSGLQRLMQDLAVAILADLPIETQVARGADAGIPIVVSHPDSITTRQFLHLGNHLKATLLAGRSH